MLIRVVHLVTRDAVLLLTAVVVAGLAFAFCAEPVALSGTEKEMLDALNNFRARQNLAALTPTASLMNRSRSHAAWMASRHSMTHSSGIQENIAAGQQSVADVQRTWEHSGGHNANMRTRNKNVGVACAKSSNGVLYWCQQFATEAQQ